MNKDKRGRERYACAVSVIIIILLTALDQYTKYLAVRYLKDQPPIVLIPGVLELNYLENTGMAWGMFSGRRTLFLILTILFFAVGLYIFIKVPKNSYYGPFIAALILLVSGGLGNFIDRLRLGAVTDFISVPLIHFPTFNVADIQVVCGGILLFFIYCLKYKDNDFAFLTLKRKQ